MIGAVNVKVSIDGYKDIPEGRATVAQMWTGDIVSALQYLPEGTKPDVLGFWYPNDRKGIVNNDCMAVLAKAKHPVLAHLLINFLLDPANATDNYTFVGYQPALSATTADVLKKSVSMPDQLQTSLMTDSDVKNGYRILSLVPDVDKIYEDTFATFKAGG
jgi:spermidine/putrescine transport system substrate-binding protein